MPARATENHLAGKLDPGKKQETATGRGKLAVCLKLGEGTNDRTEVTLPSQQKPGAPLTKCTQSLTRF